MELIPAIIVLGLVALVFFVIYRLIAKRWPGTPSIIAGIVLALIWLLILIELFGVPHRRIGAKPQFRQHVIFRAEEPARVSSGLWIL